MDPLTIFGAVTGGISAASEILKTLEWAISTTGKIRSAPETAQATLRDVAMIHRNLVRFRQLQDNLSVPQARLTYIPLHDTKNTFIDCVSSLDELEDVLRPLADPALDALSLSERFRWVMKDSRIAELSGRLHNAQNSMGFMLTIMQHESLMEVSNAVTSLAHVTQKIAEDVASILRTRSLSSQPRPLSPPHNPDGDALEDENSTLRGPTVTVRPDSLVLPQPRDSMLLYSKAERPSSRPPQQYDFEQDLQTSVPYRRVPRWSKDDISMRSSVLNYHALSFLSDLSLGDVSAMSVVQLPIFRADITNCHHYPFRDHEPGTMPPPGEPGAPSPPATVIYKSVTVLPSPPPTPQSPSTGLLDVLRPSALLRRATLFRRRSLPDIPKAQAPGPAAEAPTTPPRTPTRQPSPSRLSSPTLLEENQTYSLAQLSNVSIESSNLTSELDTLIIDSKDDSVLSHPPDNRPCFGIVGSDGFRDRLSKHAHEQLKVLEQTRAKQAQIAASRGHLEYFRCRSCHSSLPQIISTGAPGWNQMEIWCGDEQCALKLAHASPFRFCPCHAKLRQVGATAKFYGCRNLSSMEVRCARCYEHCAGCVDEARRREPPGLVSASLPSSTTSSSPFPSSPSSPSSSPFSWTARLYETQNMLLETQSALIETPGDPRWHVRLAILDRETGRLRAVLAALNERAFLLEQRGCLQRVLDRPDTGNGPDRAETRSQLDEVEGKLKAYGSVYKGRVAKKQLVRLNGRQEILTKRLELLKTVSPRHLIDASLDDIVWGSKVYFVSRQLEAFRQQLSAFSLGLELEMGNTIGIAK